MVESRLSVASIALVFLSMLMPEFVQAAVGRTSGTFNVSSTGAATYQIPIWVPPGTKGVQPNLAFAYNSQSGDGTMGPGWSLNGLGSITRCNKTYAQDQTPTPVQLVASDGYCFNGNRLRLTGGTYGSDASTYQTEVAEFSLITAKSSAGNGPSYFIVKGKDGLTYEYGNSTNSRITPSSSLATPYLWLLNKVSDRAGNNYVVTYGTGASGSAGVGVPQSISYTPVSASSSSYTYSVAFSYGPKVSQFPSTNDPAIVGYVAGTQVVNTNLLLSVAISNISSGSSVLVRKYTLGYSAAPTTTRARLTSITECGGSAGTDCLLPTTISYQDGAAGVSSTATVALGGTPYVLTSRDFNGDGREDILYQDSATSALYVLFATSTGFQTPVQVLSSAGTVTYGDLTGHGQDDLLIAISGVWWRYVWNGSAFVGTSIGVATDSGMSGAVLIDINGDGLPDLVTLATVSSTTYVHTRLNTSTGDTAAFSSTENTGYSFGVACPIKIYDDCDHLISAGTETNSTAHFIDFNGDGRQDLVFQVDYYKVDGTEEHDLTQLISNGTTFTAGQSISLKDSGYFYYADINHDGCTDAAGLHAVYISACNGFTGSTVSLNTTDRVVGVLDWDSDGRDDVLVYSSSAAALQIRLSNGTGFQSGTTVSIPYNIMFDSDGDGQTDVGGISGTNFVYNLHNSAGHPADLVTSVTDGYGNSVSPSYVSITQGKYSTWADAVYPYLNYIKPLYVVDQTTFSDPSNSNATYQQGFWYAGAWKNLQGRGFVGFGAIQRYDSRNGLWETWNYGRPFPYTGILTADTVAQTNTNSVLVNVLNNTLAATILDSTAINQRYFPYVSLATSSAYEVGGSKNGQLISQSSTSFAYDNYGNLTSSTATLTDTDSSSPQSPTYNQTWTKVVTNTISPDTTNWCLGIPTQTTVQQYATNVSSITRTMSFTPDYVNCRVSQQVVEPSSSAYKVTTDYGYDSFGNVNSQTVTGVNMTSRTTTANWGTAGQFPVSVTNALNQTSTAGYDYNLGVQTSITDPNSIATSWTYDNFGRKTKETRPDGTYTVWAYNDCANWGGCLIGGHALALAHYYYGTDGSVISDGTNYFDPFDRLVITNKRMLASGTYDRNEVRYDSLGRVQQQAMPCTWTAVATACPYWTTNTHDALNRLTQQQRPISAGNSTLQTSSVSYQGLTTITTDPQGKQTTKIVDPNGWLRRSQDHNGYYQSFAYDAFGSLKTVTDSQSNTLFSASYAYGVDAFQTATTDMDLGTWGYTPDALGEVVAYTDAKSSAFSMTYDALSRPLTRFVSGEGTATWTWGNAAASYNVGQLQSIASLGYTETYTYDNKSRLSNRHIVSDAAYDYDYTYSSTTGLVDTLTYPTSTSSYRLKLQYAYQNGLLSQVKDYNASTIFWQANAMNPRGQITQETLGNGIVANRTFDAVTGWVSSLQAGVGGGTGVQNESYLFDQVGNVTQRQNNTLGLTENFYYDNLYRLDYSKLNGVTNLDMTYDALGNITHRTDVASNAAWTYDATHKHQIRQAGDSSHTYTYDANGNAITRNGFGITWNKYNYPAVINGSATTSATFSYDAYNQKWKQVLVNGSYTGTDYFIGGLMVKGVSGSTTAFSHYIYAGAEPIAVYQRKSDNTTALYYLLDDHQGSVDKVTTSAGALYISENFAAYGARRNATTWSGAPNATDQGIMNNVTRNGFTWQAHLDYLGVINMKGRVEDPTTGIFLSADPYLTDPGNTQNFNRYSYVYNNPVSYTDPSGFEICAIGSSEACSGGGGGGGGLEEIVVTGHNDGPPDANFGTSSDGMAEVIVYGGGGSATRAKSRSTRAAQRPKLEVQNWQVLLPWTILFNIMDYNEQQVPSLAVVDAVLPLEEVVVTAKVVRGVSVLGKFPNYLKLADDLGAKRFNIPTNVWNKMSKAEQWAANQKYLDRAIARGDDIILSDPVKDINNVTGAFRQELDYLIGNGFRLSVDGTRLIR